MNEKSKRAVELFNVKYGCAQSVAAAFGEDYGLDANTMLKLSGALNGGCQSAELCGAVSGILEELGY